MDKDLLQQCTALLEYLSMWVAMADTCDATRNPDAEVDALLKKLHTAGERGQVAGPDDSKPTQATRKEGTAWK